MSSTAAAIDGKEPAQAEQPERLLTITEVAVWLGVSKAWVYDHAGRKITTWRAESDEWQRGA